MSVRFRLVNMFDSSVSTLLATECQKYSTRWLSPMNREPIDHVGPALEDRLDQLAGTRPGRIQVGVLHDDDVAGRSA